MAFFLAILRSSLFEVKNLRLRCSERTFERVTFFRKRRIKWLKDSLSRRFTFTKIHSPPWLHPDAIFLRQSMKTSVRIDSQSCLLNKLLIAQKFGSTLGFLYSGMSIQNRQTFRLSRGTWIIPVRVAFSKFCWLQKGFIGSSKLGR